jgi:hypothetical protein
VKIVLLILLNFGILRSNSQTMWQPSPQQQVPQIIDCSIGDVAAARFLPSPHIRYCPAAANALNQQFPGAGHFYFVHEYGHILRGSSEVEADNFATEELAVLNGGYYYINAVLRQLYYRDRMGDPGRPGYGTPLERAERIRNWAISANSSLQINSETGLLY